MKPKVKKPRKIKVWAIVSENATNTIQWFSKKCGAKPYAPPAAIFHSQKDAEENVSFECQKVVPCVILLPPKVKKILRDK